MKNYSLWLENMNFTPNKALDQNINVDVLIVGGGITGLSSAYHLKNSNLKVALIEKNLIAHGVTARTTGKLTYLQELIYTKIKKFHNEDKAKLYLKSQQKAIKIVEDIIKKHNIDCDFMKVNSLVFTNEEKEIPKIKEEKKLLENWKIKVEQTSKVNDLVNSKYCIKVNDTAVFHPLKYLIKLKEICQNHVSIYENSKLISVEKVNDSYICHVNNYEIKTKYIVFACHYPYFLIPFLMPTKTYLEKSYITATKIKEAKNYSAITSKKPTKSIRFEQDSKNSYLIFLSNSHNLCNKLDYENNFKDTINKLKKTPDFIWSNKDIITYDYLPFIGEIKDNMFIATGYNTWGMTNGSLAGKIISDLILKKDNKYTALFNPKRAINMAKIINFPLNIGSSLKSLTENKIIKNKSWYEKNIKFENRKGTAVAIYQDEFKKEHIVKNICPHFKCSLVFNEIEKTWDCPCHGSRFDIDGKCIEGPANFDISYKD